jgi:hypothetical protein
MDINMKKIVITVTDEELIEFFQSSPIPRDVDLSDFVITNVDTSDNRVEFTLER